MSDDIPCPLGQDTVLHLEDIRRRLWQKRAEQVPDTPLPSADSYNRAAALISAQRRPKRDGLRSKTLDDQV